MIELVPEQLDDAVILNVSNHCASGSTDCKSCSDIGVAVHNWLISSELGYVIVDLQDEKDICPTFLIELIQLRKRLRLPFLFSGVVERPRKVLDEYAFTVSGTPIFITPEEAIDYLGEHHSPLLHGTDFSLVSFGNPLQVARPKMGVKGDAEDSESEAETDD